MVDVLRMVTQCIGMTGSSNEAEATSMALKACHAILKHKLVVLMPDDPRLTAPTPSPSVDPFEAATKPPPPPRPPARGTRDATPPGPTRTWRGSNPFVDETGSIPAAQAKSKGGNGRPKHWDRDAEPVKLTNKYPAFCKGCGVHCEPGEKVWWMRNVGVCCADCGGAPLVG
jgi:hypothetical protein